MWLSIQVTCSTQSAIRQSTCHICKHFWKVNVCWKDRFIKGINPLASSRCCMVMSMCGVTTLMHQVETMRIAIRKCVWNLLVNCHNLAMPHCWISSWSLLHILIHIMQQHVISTMPIYYKYQKYQKYQKCWWVMVVFLFILILLNIFCHHKQGQNFVK